MSLIDDLCANADCALCDEGDPSAFASWADWEFAHSFCKVENGGPINRDVYSYFDTPHDTDDGKWKRTR